MYRHTLCQEVDLISISRIDRRLKYHATISKQQNCRNEPFWMITCDPQLLFTRAHHRPAWHYQQHNVFVSPNQYSILFRERILWKKVGYSLCPPENDGSSLSCQTVAVGTCCPLKTSQKIHPCSWSVCLRVSPKIDTWFDMYYHFRSGQQLIHYTSFQRTWTLKEIAAHMHMQNAWQQRSNGTLIEFLI